MSLSAIETATLSSVALMGSTSLLDLGRALGELGGLGVLGGLEPLVGEGQKRLVVVLERLGGERLELLGLAGLLAPELLQAAFGGDALGLEGGGTCRDLLLGAGRPQLEGTPLGEQPVTLGLDRVLLGDASSSTGPDQGSADRDAGSEPDDEEHEAGEVHGAQPPRGRRQLPGAARPIGRPVGVAVDAASTSSVVLMNGTSATWTTAQVVRMTGVTSRTLRHYDSEGVVVPVGVGLGGVRLYGRDELLRLQQVLVLRELGLSLPAVRAVVDGTTDRAVALRDHRERLLVERDRLDRLAATVARTIEDLEGGEEMTEDQLFEGFDPERQKAYERELVEDWGVQQDEIDRSKGAVSAMGPEGFAANGARWTEIETALVSLMQAGAAPDGEPVLDLLVEHWELTGRYWGRPPSAEAYAGMATMYAEHPEFRARYEAMAPGFAEWISEAVTAYALTRLL